MKESPLATYCQQLMQTSQELFDLTAYQASYHALVAALNCASDMQDFDTLLEIGDLAKGQLVVIDRRQPDHVLSTASATRQGRHSLHRILTQRARLKATLLQSQVERRYYQKRRR